MMITSIETCHGPNADPFDEELIEVPLLLTGQQAAALELAARQRGLTSAQLLRRLIREFTEE
jgi:GAF domain-containing protein